MIDRLRTRLIVFFALIIGAGSLPAALGEESPFSLFKLNGVESACLIPRLTSNGNAFWGRSRVGAAGGAALTDGEARQAYDCVREAMARSYARSGVKAAQTYSGWQRFSSAPYPSATHGNRYVNNYANAIAAPYYGRYENAGVLPAGSILAKDSFVVNDNGRVIFGALALMQKMPPNSATPPGNWRYTLILPDGRLFGSSDADEAEKVRFCQSCHAALKNTQDSLFFIPQQYRR